jgi:hypothetical protein
MVGGSKIENSFGSPLKLKLDTRSKLKTFQRWLFCPA